MEKQAMASSLTPTLVEASLYEALAGTRGCTADEVRASVGPGGVIDSLEGVELIASVEALYGITIGDSELSSTICKSVVHLAELETV